MTLVLGWMIRGSESTREGCLRVNKVVVSAMILRGAPVPAGMIRNLDLTADDQWSNTITIYIFNHLLLSKPPPSFSTRN